MYNPESFKDRVVEARAAARFGYVVRRDASGRPIVVDVPGHYCTRYQVIVRREVIGGKTVLSTECRKDGGPVGFVPCNGNLSGHCYHSIAAIIVVAEDGGWEVGFSDSLDSAAKLKNFGSRATLLYSWQNKGLSPLGINFKWAKNDVD